MTALCLNIGSLSKINSWFSRDNIQNINNRKKIIYYFEIDFKVEKILDNL